MRGIVSTAMAVWIAVATLHREYGVEKMFSQYQIEAKIEEQMLCEVSPKTVELYIRKHCVANIKPWGDPQRKTYYCRREDKYRLYREGDECYSSRHESKAEPAEYKLPEGYKHLKKWYDEVYCDSSKRLGS